MPQNPRTDDRPRGVIAHVLDPDVLLDAARTVYARNHPGANAAVLVGHGPLPHVTFPADDSTAEAVVNADGVGATTVAENIPVHVTVAGDPAVLNLPASIIEQAKTPETVDLADAITPGPEGDQRHAVWHRRYSA